MTEPVNGAGGEAVPVDGRVREDIQITAAVKLKLLPEDRTRWDNEQISATARELANYLTQVYDVRRRPAIGANDVQFVQRDDDAGSDAPPVPDLPRHVRQPGAQS